MRKSVMIVLACLVLGACSQDPTSFTDQPEIGFMSIKPAVVKEFNDKFYIEVSYKDGDGNLGHPDPDMPSVFVTDLRSDLVYSFRLRDLSTPNGEPNIKGTLTIEMPPTAVLEEGKNSENANFSVVIKDQDGNESNVVTTSSILVEK